MNFNQLNKEKNNKEIWLFSAVTALLVALTVCGFFIFPKLALQKTEAVPVIAEAPKEPEPKPKFESAQFIASAVYVKDLKTGEVLFEKNPKEQMPLASITKLMTALVVSRSFENKNVSVAFSPTQYTVPEIFSLRDALKALLVFSSNESADSVAQITGKNFVENMNYTATTLGLKSMKFNKALDLS
jgi:D-alanyl-D-alanine carboxypeptidase